jgi:hypothetical protein
LTAGVSGGKKLLQSAKIQNSIKRITEVKIAVNMFYWEKGNERLPGDFDDDTMLCAGVQMHDGWSGSFEGKFATNTLPENYAQYDFSNSGKVGECVLFWAELYENKLLNFKPIPDLQRLRLSIDGGLVSPHTNHLRADGANGGKYTNGGGFILDNKKRGYYFNIYINNTGEATKASSVALDGSNSTLTGNENFPKIAEAFDIKLDDGNPDTGDIVYYYGNRNNWFGTGLGSIYYRFFEYR